MFSTALTNYTHSNPPIIQRHSLHKFVLLLNSSVYRAYEIVQNDIKIGTISWGSKVEIQFLNFRVGKSVGVRHGTKFRYELA